MAEMGRFIQFNNEQLNARQMLQYEMLARALAGNKELAINERQLIEMNPQQQKLSLSVFWRHREEAVMHLGRLSDIYLMAAGFWRSFDVRAYLDYVDDTKNERLPRLRRQLVLLIEEFRLVEYVSKQRPGTAEAFDVRRRTYSATHRQQMNVHRQKQLYAEYAINYLYVAANEGTLTLPTDGFEEIHWQMQGIYDVKSTKDSIALAWRLMNLIEPRVQKDLKQNFYALFDTVSDAVTFIESKGATCLATGDKDTAKETIEEVFRAWHRETKEQEGAHLRLELGRGNEGRSLSTDAEEGDAQNDVSEVGTGGDTDHEAEPKKDDIPETKKLQRGTKKHAGEAFGDDNRHVTYKETRLEKTEDAQQLSELLRFRTEQEPLVKAMTLEFQKQMAQKQVAKRTHLSYGRLNSRELLQFVTDERPKPFYKKDAPAKPLDAVFGLLIDGSASMLDKLDETKQAVLLFHDVLRKLAIAHDMVCFYEDAYEATSTEQPNTFEWLHRLEDGVQDDGARIMALEAHEDNRDGFAIRWMAKRLLKRDEKHRFLLIFSDGEPSAFRYATNGVLDTAEAVMEAEKNGISVVHLFLNTEQPTDEQRHLFATIYGNKSVAAEDVAQFSDITLRLLRKLIRYVIQST